MPATWVLIITRRCNDFSSLTCGVIVTCGVILKVTQEDSQAILSLRVVPSNNTSRRSMDHRVKPGDDDCGCCTNTRHVHFPIQLSNSHAHSGYSFAISRRECARGMRYVSSPSKQRACGTPDAQRIRSPVCKSEKHTSVVTTNTPKTSGVPHAMGYGLLRALPGDRSSCFVTVVATEDVSQPGWAGLSGATFANVRASGPHDLGRPGNVVVSASSAPHGPLLGNPPCCLIRA